MQKKIQFKYNRIKDITEILVLVEEKILDILELPGLMSGYQKTKIRKELMEKDWG